jgi:hypothetical protein
MLIDLWKTAQRELFPSASKSKQQRNSMPARGFRDEVIPEGFLLQPSQCREL